MTMIAKRKKRGISTFIATLLLMVLAVSAGVVIYAYVMGYLGGFGGTETLGSMSLDNAKLTIAPESINTYLKVYIRNTGKVALTPVTAYIDGVKVDLTYDLNGGESPDTWPVIEGAVFLLHIDYDDYTPAIPGHFKWEAGKTYTIKVICKDNTQLSFSVKG